MEKSQKKKLFRVGDGVAILLVLLLAAGLLWAFLAADGGAFVEVTVNGERVAYLPLAEDHIRVIEAGEYELTLVIEDGRVSVCDANCPDHVCEKTGKIAGRGTAIVCTPARICVRIVGGGEGDVDHVAG